MKAYTFMKAGVIKGMSIGFETMQFSMDGDFQRVKSLSLSDDEVQHPSEGHRPPLERHSHAPQVPSGC